MAAPDSVVNDDELGDALSGLLEDDQQRTRLAETGLERAQEYAWPQVVPRYESIYADLIATPLRKGTQPSNVHTLSRSDSGTPIP